MSAESRSFLRWAGSKRKLIPQLSDYWDGSHKRYIEPFMGSAALYYAIQPSCAILGDSNLELVNTFQSIKDHPKAVFNRLQKIPLGKDSYYKLRAIDPESLSQLDRASRFIFLNRFCFNGLYRTNKLGQFNVPFASSGTGNLPTLDALKKSSKLLQGTDILKMDFEELVLKNAKKDDFVYMDPPYATENKRVFNQYGPHVFGISDLERLANLLLVLDSRQVSFVVSYGWCTEALEYLSNWNMKKVYVQRNIAGFSGHRRKSAEMFVTNIDI